MSEEEKKAIENLKKDCYECAQDNDLFENELFCSRYDVLTVLKLIKKQQEEIENSISKDKISEIIEKERCETTSGYNDWKYDENVYEAELNMINIIKKAILKGE